MRASRPTSPRSATSEAGDTPDPSYERNIAYDVDVQKGDGSTVTVHLDEAFSVLGVEADQPDHGQGARQRRLAAWPGEGHG